MMKQILSAVLVLGASAVVSYSSPQSNNDAQSCRIVENALRSHDDLRPGTTRQELERQFRHDGGLSTRGEAVYVYKRCPLIKVRIQFQRDPHVKDVNDSPSDTISSVSQLYIDYESRD